MSRQPSVFLGPSLEDLGMEGFTSFPKSNLLFLMVVGQFSWSALNFISSLGTSGDFLVAPTAMEE